MKNITAEQILQQSLYHFCWSQTETTCTNSLVLVNHESQNRISNGYVWQGSVKRPKITRPVLVPEFPKTRPVLIPLILGMNI